MGVEKWDLFNTALVYFRCVQVQRRRWVGFIDFWCAEGTNNKLLPGGPSITFGRCAVFQLNNNCWDGLLWHWRVAKESYSQRQGTEVGEKFISGECAWYICVYRNLAKCSIEAYLRDTLYIHDPSIHTSTLLLLLDLSPGNKGETTYSACLPAWPVVPQIVKTNKYVSRVFASLTSRSVIPEIGPYWQGFMWLSSVQEDKQIRVSPDSLYRLNSFREAYFVIVSFMFHQLLEDFKYKIPL